MTFRFKRKEDFETGFRRIADEQIERALTEWKNKERAVAVHETRKCIKRLRALLRLVRPSLTPRDFRAENAFLRDIGRGMSVSRDRQVMMETILLLKSEAGPDDIEALDVMQRRILEDRSEAAGSNELDARKTAKTIAEAGRRLARLEIQRSGFDIVAPGFEMTYRKGRAAMADAVSARSEQPSDRADEVSHEWRKYVQAHWRQLSLLSAAWPGFFQARIAFARQISEGLGKDHDLAILQNRASNLAADELGAERFAAVCGLIEALQARLRRQSFYDGKLLYADGPAGLSRRVRRYWEIASAPSSPGKRSRLSVSRGPPVTSLPSDFAKPRLAAARTKAEEARHECPNTSGQTVPERNASRAKPRRKTGAPARGAKETG
jgi:CHAD domain-containing protein